jgi:hypothetical protein
MPLLPLRDSRVRTQNMVTCLLTLKSKVDYAHVPNRMEKGAST